MPTPQPNVVASKPPQVLPQDLENKAREVDEQLKLQQDEFERNQIELETAQAEWLIAEIDAELAIALLDKERRIEKARPPVDEVEKARTEAKKQFEALKREEPEKIVALQLARDGKAAELEKLVPPQDVATRALKAAEEALAAAKAQKESADKAATEAKQALDKAEGELKAALDERAKLSLEDRAKAQDKRRTWMEAEAELKKAEARFHAEKLEAEKEYAKAASDARKRQLAIVTALPSKARPAPVAG
ncbi:hypothetical protein D7Y11_18175 [Corallococcus sp. AB018]|uniref:hypothetical protein n=1 Tax=Corallococcus sp. AB018 TaxID=2316715 RepID=UPI000F864BB9|nr:hypothetical protein [Corallococcus sp. AB018]RUO91785.1 hypothetical protein D7Y11_18175 [Corallococcus sp. AB018]